MKAELDGVVFKNAGEELPTEEEVCSAGKMLQTEAEDEEVVVIVVVRGNCKRKVELVAEL